MIWNCGPRPWYRRFNPQCKTLVSVGIYVVGYLGIVLLSFVLGLLGILP